MSDAEIKTFTTRRVTLKGVIISKENDYLITKIHTIEIKQRDGSFVIHHADKYVQDGKTYWLERADHKRNVIYYREQP